MRVPSVSSLRARLLLLILLGLAPALFFRLYTGFLEYQAAASDATEEGMRIARFNASTQAQLLNEMRTLLPAIALLPQIRGGDLTACNQVLSSLLELHPYTANLGFINEDAMVVCSGLAIDNPVDVSDRDYYQRALSNRGFAIGSYQIGRITGKPGLNVGYPVIGQDAEIIGVVFAALDLAWINNLAAQAQLPPGSTVTVVDREGTILARYPDPDLWVSKQLEESPLVTALNLGKTEGTLETEGLDGETRLFAFVPLYPDHSQAAQVVVGIPSAIAYAPVIASLKRGLIGLGLIATLGLLIAWLGADRMILRKTRIIMDVTQRIAGGELGIRTQLSIRDDEISQLAHAVDIMAESLEIRFLQLERAKEALTRLNRTLRVLSGGNQAVVRSNDKTTLLDEMCRVLIQQGEYACVWIGFLNGAGRPSILLSRQAGFQSDSPESWALAEAGIGSKAGPTSRALETRSPVVVEDILSEPEHEAWRDEARQLGYNSFAIFPLGVHEDQIMGTLNIYAREQDAFSPEEMAVLSEFADDLSFGLRALQERELRRQSEDEVRRLKEFSEGIVQSMTEGVVIEDAQGLITFVNPAGAQILGYSERDLIKKHWVELIPPDQSHRIQHAYERRKQGLADQYEIQLLRKDLTPVDVLVSTRPNFDAGLFSGTLSVFTNITELRHSERTAHRQERLASVGQLAAGIAHDFNNILGGIILYSQLQMKTAGLEDDSKERLNTIVTQAKRGAELVSQILDFSRKSVLSFHPINLGEVMRELQQLLSRTLPENIHVEANVEEKPLVVRADETRIQQVIMNLAVNARDAMPKGGRFSIELRAQNVDPESAPFREMPPGEWARLSFTDTGEGIPEDVLPHIFEPFFTTKKAGEGTGLGLAQVYGIIKQHNGFIDVDTTLGQGSTFSIYVPIYRGPAEEVFLLGQDVQFDGRRQTVMVVEDEQVAREATVEILEAMNCSVLQVRTGTEALEILKTTPRAIQLILCDYAMPDMDGRSFFDGVSVDYPNLQIAFMSEYPLGEGASELFAQDNVEWLSKPFAVDGVTRILKRALG